jgi:hypothetical protein
MKFVGEQPQTVSYTVFSSRNNTVLHTIPRAIQPQPPFLKGFSCHCEETEFSQRVRWFGTHKPVCWFDRHKPA